MLTQGGLLVSDKSRLQEHRTPNLFPIGWGILYLVPNWLSDYLGFISHRREGNGLVSGCNKVKQSIKFKASP